MPCAHSHRDDLNNGPCSFFGTETFVFLWVYNCGESQGLATLSADCSAVRGSMLWPFCRTCGSLEPRSSFSKPQKSAPRSALGVVGALPGWPGGIIPLPHCKAGPTTHSTTSALNHCAYIYNATHVVWERCIIAASLTWLAGSHSTLQGGAHCTQRHQRTQPLYVHLQYKAC